VTIFILYNRNLIYTVLRRYFHLVIQKIQIYEQSRGVWTETLVIGRCREGRSGGLRLPQYRLTSCVSLASIAIIRARLPIDGRLAARDGANRQGGLDSLSGT